MSCVIQIVGWAAGLSCNAAGQYILYVDVQKAPETEEWLLTTPDIDKARRWEDRRAALETYYEILESDPVREDGKPNRPLTALTVRLVPVFNFNEDGTWRSDKSR